MKYIYKVTKEGLGKSTQKILHDTATQEQLAIFYNLGLTNYVERKETEGSEATKAVKRSKR